MTESLEQQLARTPLTAKATEHARSVAGVAENEQNWLLEGVVIQQCKRCKQYNYPAEALCPNCLSDGMHWQHRPSRGTILSFTSLHVSFNKFYQQASPWPIGLIEQQDGIRLLSFLNIQKPSIGDTVQLFTVPDVVGQSVFVAVAEQTSAAKKAQELIVKLHQS